MAKMCKHEGCTKERAKGRSECYKHYGERRRSNKVTRWKSDGGPRILFIDIETMPAMVWTWSFWNANIGLSQVIQPGRTICAAARWYGEDETIFLAEWQDGGTQAMVEALWKLLDEADIVVHFYGSRFDVPHLNTMFLKYGLTAPTPYKQVDLKNAVAKTFKFDSNKLDFVARVLGLEGKEEHEGFPLWAKCIGLVVVSETEIVMGGEHRDPDALKRMEKYNRRDTVLLEEVYEVLLPWLPDHPHRHLYSGSGGCPRCGTEGTIVEHGYAYTKLSKFQQYKCEACGYYARSSRRLQGVSIQDSVL